MKKIALLLGLTLSSVLYSQQTQKVYLSGTGSDQTVDWEFYCTEGMNAGKWTTIPVPSNWELQGFGAYNYGYDPQDKRADEQGLYKHSFQVPDNWKGQKINIVFEASMTDTEVMINGNLAGSIHQGAFYRFKYDISELLKYGQENLLEVKVWKVSSNESVNKAERNADYWIFGGIYRPVYLEVLPKEHIEKVAINATSKGLFQCEINFSDSHKADEVSVSFFAVANPQKKTRLNSKIKGKETVLLETKLQNPKLWSAEFPNLYQAEIQLLKKGKVIHAINQKFGFRTLEIRERDGVYLNGVKIKFKGINRHCFWPSTGRALSRSNSLADAQLIKGMNMNVVRNAHYPADDHFYEICDSIGLMVFDELGGWHDAYDTGVGGKLVKEMIDKSRNHPCVVLWINGNEGGHNQELLSLYEKHDIQKRHVIHAWEISRGTDTQHYRDYNYGIGSHYQGHEVFFPTEFLHGLYDGGHGAGMEDFWKLMWDNPLSAGGLTWDFADEAVVRTDKNGMLDSDGNHGADGIVGPYHEKEGSYFTLKEVWAPIYFEHREITNNFDGKFRIENHFHFTNINQCQFKYVLRKFTRRYPAGVTSKEGDIVAPNIPPLQKDTLSIELPSNWKTYDFLYITATDPHDNHIFTWSWPISLPSDIANNAISHSKGQRAMVIDMDTVLVIRSDNQDVTLNKNSGLLAGVENEKGKISFDNGPVLCEGTSFFAGFEHHYLGDTLIITGNYADSSIMQEVIWTIYPSGWIGLDVTYCPEVERHSFMGINFDYPEDKVKGIDWMGDGPYRVWKNRMKGNSLGVWHKYYNNTITGQSEYKYPEFKGFHSRMYWLRVNTTEQPFVVMTPDEDLFFRMYTPETPKDPYNTAPEFPDGDISFMQGITPMGTKTLQTFRMGPMSEENIRYTFAGNRPIQMKLYFKFSEK